MVKRGSGGDAPTSPLHKNNNTLGERVWLKCRIGRFWHSIAQHRDLNREWGPKSKQAKNLGVVPSRVWSFQYPGAAVKGFCYSVSATGSGPNDKQERGSKGNFDLFSPGAELTLAVLCDRWISDRMFLNLHLCCVVHPNVIGSPGSDITNSLPWGLEKRSFKGCLVF